MRIEQWKWLAWLHRLHPQIDLAQFYSHWVDIDAVDTTAYYIVQCRSHSLQSRLFFPATYRCQFFSNALRRCNQKMTTATGRVADLEVKNSFLCIMLLTSLSQCGFQCRIKQAIYQACWRVIAARHFALVS